MEGLLGLGGVMCEEEEGVDMSGPKLAGAVLGVGGKVSGSWEL